MSGQDEEKFRYVGQRYRQGASNIDLITFCASAGDIRRWGGVPAKTERFHGGFQRALQTPRYEKIRNFFNQGQASPTSVVVAFRSGALQVSDLAYPPSWPAVQGLAAPPTFVHIEFGISGYDLEKLSVSELAEQVKILLEERLSLQERSSDTEADEDEPEQSVATDTQEEELEDDEVTASEIDIGHSKLKAFYDFITNPVAISDWIALEEERLRQLKPRRGRKALSDDPQGFTPEERLKYSLHSLLQPAMIVDGQHRVWGAYHSDQASKIMFSVCAIRDAEWVEQVFQFVVLNKLARPISPTFLTGLLNTSLTNDEVGEIETRFEDIGIRNTDRIIMKYLNHVSTSPFYGMVAQAGEIIGIGAQNRGKLSDKGMIRLAKRWLSIESSKDELRMFQKALGKSSHSKAREEWHKADTWTKWFFAFWGAIKERFEPEQIWEKQPKYHLLYIVTMHAMQDMFIEAKAEAMVQYDSIEQFHGQVSEFFESVPSAFFKNWTATGLQSGEGPLWIKEAIRGFKRSKKLRDIEAESPLFNDKNSLRGRTTSVTRRAGKSGGPQ